MELVREFKRKTLKLKLDGSEYKVLFPTVKQLSEFQKDFKKEQELDLMTSFLEKLDLPKEVAEGLEAEHLKEIFEIISGQKKS